MRQTIEVVSSILIDVPNDWVVRYDEECLTIIPSEGSALQFSGASKEIGPVTDTDLRDIMLRNAESNETFEPIVIGVFEGYCESFDVAKTHWRRWHLRYSNRVLFITYNCNVNLRGSETIAIDCAVSSLRPSLGAA
jgi:hypothetical protein